MPAYKAPLDDFDFLYNEFLDLGPCAELPTMAEASPDVIEAVLSEAAKVAENVLQPLNAVGDEIGCQLNEAEAVVNMPEGFGEAYRDYCEGGWTGLIADPDFGGQGLPNFVGLALSEMINAANASFAAYPGLTLGAYEVIHHHGTDAQKATYLPKMVSGEWGGTMNLTEPHCGTDLGLLRTRAEPAADGSYRITGKKTWCWPARRTRRPVRAAFRCLSCRNSWSRRTARSASATRSSVLAWKRRWASRPRRPARWNTAAPPDS